MSYSEDDLILSHAKFGSLEGVQRALAAGANIEKRDNHGFTPLLLAAANGAGKVLSYLIDQGADVAAAVPDTGRNGLHLALANGWLSVCGSILLERGLDPNIGDKSGITVPKNVINRGHRRF